MRVLQHEQVRPLVEELARRLAETGAATGVRIVGGAAISLHGFVRRPTRDVDAVFLHADDVTPVILEMAEQFDLEHNWCNDAAMAFIPAVGLEDWIEVHRSGDVVVSIASIDLLIAMKLFANRASRDWDDLFLLLDAANISSVEQAQEIYERYHAQDVIPETAVVRLREWLAGRSASSGA